MLVAARYLCEGSERRSDPEGAAPGCRNARRPSRRKWVERPSRRTLALPTPVRQMTSEPLTLHRRPIRPGTVSVDKHPMSLGAPRVGVGTGDPRLVPGVRSWLRFFKDCNWKEPLACRTVSRW